MSSPMRGWEAYDSVGPEKTDGLVIRSLGGTEDWPDNEITNGVAFVEIQTHADDPTGSFVRVVGPDRDGVGACFLRCREEVLAGTFASLVKGPAA